MNIAVALFASVIGAIMLVAAVASDGAPPLEPIPLARSRIATPVRFPHTPPIRSTPMFVASAATPDLFMGWQRDTLERWYFPPRPTFDVNMGH